MNKRLFFKGVLMLVILSGLILLTYRYVFHEHRNIAEEIPTFVVNSDVLTQEFREDANAATEKYLDRTLQVTGEITAIDNAGLVIDKAISCYFESALNNSDLVLNGSITVKGRCLGYDDLLEEIKMDQCVLIKN